MGPSINLSMEFTTDVIVTFSLVTPAECRLPFCQQGTIVSDTSDNEKGGEEEKFFITRFRPFDSPSFPLPPAGMEIYTCI